MPAAEQSGGRGRGMVQKAVIYKIVTHHLFQLVKFFDPVKDAQYTKNKDSMCQFVLNKIQSIPKNVSPDFYWDIAHRYVRVSISQLRSNRISELKKAFFGEYFVGCF